MTTNIIAYVKKKGISFFYWSWNVHTFYEQRIRHFKENYITQQVLLYVLLATIPSIKKTLDFGKLVNVYWFRHKTKHPES